MIRVFGQEQQPLQERFWSSKKVTDIDHMLYRLKDVNQKLEELGITHIKNRDVILRNISNHQNITALKTLSDVCEPLKIYSRNAGGTEYKSYSPFTLFADACIADAQDAVLFNKAVNTFEKNNNAKSLKVIKGMLEIWSRNHEVLLPIVESPNVQPIVSLSQNLSKISKLLLTTLTKKELTQASFDDLELTLNELKKPYADVELAIHVSLKKLIKFW